VVVKEGGWRSGVWRSSGAPDLAGGGISDAWAMIWRSYAVIWRSWAGGSGPALKE
jgi:hypothetical protein